MLRITVEEVGTADAENSTVLGTALIRDDDTGIPVLGRIVVVLRPKRHGRPRFYRYMDPNVRLHQDVWDVLASALSARRRHRVA